MRVRWSDSAKSQLKAIRKYIARDSKQYAQAMVDRIISRSKDLSKFPGIGHLIPESEASGIRQVLEGSYRIIYRITTGSVEVLAVIHSARDWFPGPELFDDGPNA